MAEATAKSKAISVTGYVAQVIDRSVYEMALERIRHLFTLSDCYVVSFSGGKDSTTVLQLSLQVARELGRLPLEVAMIDEEVLDPDTISYVSGLQQHPDIRLRWFCVPIRHTLRSKGRSGWYTWDPREREVWARELPPDAITDLEGMDDGTSYRDVLKLFYLKHLSVKNFICATGIRVEESFNRRRTILGGGSYIVQDGRCIYAKPIYDWSTKDIWKAILENDWPYSTFYNKLWLKQLAPHSQRIGPWGNVAQARVIRYFPEFYADFWERATKRLPELRAAQRYGDTELYREVLNKPLTQTWQEYTFHLIESLDEDSKKFWLNQINLQLKRWRRKATVPFPEEMEVGACWKRFAYMVGKNDRIKGISRDRQ